MQIINELKYIINQTINNMKTFTYDEVVEMMSQCLNNLEDRIEINDCIELGDYTLRMEYDNCVYVDDANFDAENLLNEISIDFKDRLDDLAKYKESSINLNK